MGSAVLYLGFIAAGAAFTDANVISSAALPLAFFQAKNRPA
jgi:hypothetical protein